MFLAPCRESDILTLCKLDSLGALEGGGTQLSGDPKALALFTDLSEVSPDGSAGKVHHGPSQWCVGRLGTSSVRIKLSWQHHKRVNVTTRGHDDHGSQSVHGKDAICLPIGKGISGIS